jgi:hypothetical protein
MDQISSRPWGNGNHLYHESHPNIIHSPVQRNHGGCRDFPPSIGTMQFVRGVSFFRGGGIMYYVSHCMITINHPVYPCFGEPSTGWIRCEGTTKAMCKERCRLTTTSWQVEITWRGGRTFFVCLKSCRTLKCRSQPAK